MQLREKLGLTQEEFARLVGVSIRTVARWDTGKPPSKLAQQRLDKLEADYQKEKTLNCA